MDEISSPNISAQIFELCDTDLFQDSLQQNSDVTSSSNCCQDENNINNNNNSSYTTLNNISQALDLENNNINNNNNSNSNSTATTTSTTSTTNTNNITNNTNNNLSIIFDSQEEIDNDISASIDFTSSSSFLVPTLLPINTTHQEQFDFSSTQPHHNLELSNCSVLKGLSSQYQTDISPVSAPAQLIGAASFPSMFEDDCISSIPSCNPYLSNGLGLYMPQGNLNTALSADSSSLFGGGILLGSEMQTQDLDYQGENGGIYCTDSVQQVFNPQDFQALGTENHKLVSGAGSANLAPEISHLEDSSLKVGKLSVEQRKEKIHRYMKKRNERNFSKKIKYACRKTLADSRPRVRGRFAKNDDFGENQRAASSNHEDDDEIVVKEEDDMVDSSDIFAHISGLNSFKCNYSIQSLI
ncbi:CCT motif family protein [Trifolium repens]|nr:CCT motif family protein [Trifolium repens]